MAHRWDRHALRRLHRRCGGRRGLYDEQIHVPLLVKWAKRAPAGAESKIVRHIDVAPTLVSLAGAEIPAAMQGVSLLDDPAGRKPKDLQHYAEEDHEGDVLWSLRTRDTKLIVANEGNPRGLPSRALFRVDRDPEETANLAGQEMAAERELEKSADAHRRFAEGEAVSRGADVEMSREECEQLRLLGYIEDCSHIQN